MLRVKGKSNRVASANNRQSHSHLHVMRAIYNKYNQLISTGLSTGNPLAVSTGKSVALAFMDGQQEGLPKEKSVCGQDSQGKERMWTGKTLNSAENVIY